MIDTSSVLEIIDTSNSILESRTSSLSLQSGLGPPDICLVKREHQPSGLKRWISKSCTRSYYHNIYGVDTSSEASIAAYFRHFLDSSSLKSSKSRVFFGCFCSFDLFSKSDIRVEIAIPGQTTAYLVDYSGNKFKVKEEHWEGCYLSSGLRSFYPLQGTAVNSVELFSRLSDFERFFKVSMKFWGKIGFVLGDVRDVQKYSNNLLIPAISKYLLRRKRYRLHQRLFKSYLDKDPLILTFLAQSSCKLGKLDEILKLLKTQIKITPHAFPLYFTAAKAYLKRGEVVQAIRLCQYLIELNLEVYEYWELLVQSYIKHKDYNSALITLNQIPHYSIKSPPILKTPEENLVLPEKIFFNAAGNVWIHPCDLDFRPFEDQNISKPAKEKALIKKLETLPASALTGSKARAYRLLVKIEKNIEWDNLIKIKQSLFKRPLGPVAEEEKIMTQHLSSSGVGAGFTRTGFQTFSQDFTPEEDPAVDETLQPAQLLTYRNYFLTEWTGNKLSLIMNTLTRVQTSDTTELFSCLYNDLKAVYEWQKESSDIQAVHALKNSKGN
jgi:tetratricopeptide (TPR) repeat protein